MGCSTLTSLLKAEHYTHGDAFQVEKQRLFAVEWLPLGVAGQLTAQGDFISANIGGWPVFAVRGTDGVVRVLVNSCRHKKMLVVDQAQGSCEFFRCRFHGWTYGLDGRFRDAPLPVAPADPASDEHHLLPLRVEIAHGIVFANLCSTALGGDYAVLANDAAPRHYLGAVTSELSCNWKTLLEHALEAEPAAAWQWPLVVVHEVGAFYVIQQIMPRSFMRTRLISHVYGRPGTDRESAMAGMSGYAGKFQRACEALQARRAEGVLFSGENTRVADIHRKVAAIYAKA